MFSLFLFSSRAQFLEGGEPTGYEAFRIIHHPKIKNYFLFGQIILFERLDNCCRTVHILQIATPTRIKDTLLLDKMIVTLPVMFLHSIFDELILLRVLLFAIHTRRLESTFRASVVTGMHFVLVSNSNKALCRLDSVLCVDLHMALTRPQNQQVPDSSGSRQSSLDTVAPWTDPRPGE